MFVTKKPISEMSRREYLIRAWITFLFYMIWPIMGMGVVLTIVFKAIL